MVIITSNRPFRSGVHGTIRHADQTAEISWLTGIESHSPDLSSPDGRRTQCLWRIPVGWVSDADKNLENDPGLAASD
jgi:hypothetical protein